MHLRFAASPPRRLNTSLCLTVSSVLAGGKLSDRSAHTQRCDNCQTLSGVAGTGGPRVQVVQGKALSGEGLARLVEDMTAALNARDIPTSASLLDSFNDRLTTECAAQHSALLSALPLPTTLVRPPSLSPFPCRS